MAQDKLRAYKERFQDFTDHFADQRSRMLDDLKFSNPADPQQWNDKVRRAREDSGRPTLTFDHTNQYIMQVVNDSRQNKPSINVLPVDSGADKQTATCIEGMIRQIEYASRASISYDTSIDHAARCGMGWMRVVTETTNASLNEQDIRIKQVHDPLSVWISPESVEPDGSDAMDGFVETVMSKKAFELKYGKKKGQDSWDSPNDNWENDKTIRICEYFKIKTSKSNRLSVAMPDGSMRTHTEDEYWSQAQQLGYQPIVTAQYEIEDRSVEWCLMTGSDIIEETEMMAQWIPLVPVYGNVLWVDGKRYICGLTRQLMDGQRAKNYERSAQIEMIALQPKSPFIIPFESVENFESEWANANTSNKAYLPYNSRDESGQPLPQPTRLNPPQIPAAFVQGAQIAGDDMQAAIGMYKSNLGAPSNATSGRAKMQDQREGDTATYHFVDNQRRSIEHLGRIIVGMIPEYYDTQRETRILGMDGSAKVIRISPNTQSNHSGNVPTINPASGTYDVRVKAGPSYATQRQESSEALTEIVGKSPEMMAVLGPMWARMQDWPEADKMAKILMTMAPPQVQAIENEDSKVPPEAQGIVSSLQAQLEQMKQQLQEASQAADQNQSKIAQDHEKNEIERQKNEISMYQAETARIAALKPPDPGMTPEQVQILVMQLMNQTMQNNNVIPEEQEYNNDGIQQDQMQQPTLPGVGNEPQLS